MSLLPRIADLALEASVVGSFSRIGPAVRAALEDWTPIEEYDLSGRTVLITGANSGLGYACAELLARTGASVRFTVRSDDKGEATAERLIAATGNDDVAYDVLDLTDLDAVRAFAERFREAHPVLDGLVHNAGAMFSQRREVDGIETTTLLHVVAPMVLTAGLLPALRASPHPGRVVWVSSGGMYTEPLSVERLESPDDYAPATAYARAKRAQVVLAEQLAARLDGEVVVHAMHPGWAATPGVESSLPVFNRVMGPLLRTPTEGADTAAWLIASPVGGLLGGQFWHDRRPRTTERLPATRTTPDEVMALWARVVELAGLANDAFAPVGVG